MIRKKKMTPKQKAAARWETPLGTELSVDVDDEEPVNGDHFVISIVLIGVVIVAGTVFSCLQGGFF